MKSSESRYSRQEKIIGKNGQRKLAGAKVIVVGVGGTGSFSASLLCRAGVGELVLVDRDVVEESNLARQTLYCEDDVGESKAMCAALALKHANSKCRITAFHEQIDCAKAKEIFKGADLVLDCSDNVGTRAAINDACLHLKIPWVFCSALGMRAMVSTLVPGKTPCFGCWGNGKSPSCAEGVVGSAVQLASALQASEALALLTGGKPNFAGKMVFADLGDGSFGKIKLKRSKGCVCSTLL